MNTNTAAAAICAQANQRYSAAASSHTEPESQSAAAASARSRRRLDCCDIAPQLRESAVLDLEPEPSLRGFTYRGLEQSRAAPSVLSMVSGSWVAHAL